MAIAVAKEKAGVKGEVSLMVLPKRPNFIDELLGTQPIETSLLLGAPDRSSLNGGLHSTSALVSVSRLLRAAPLLSSGAPILMAPYQLEIH